MKKLIAIATAITCAIIITCGCFMTASAKSEAQEIFSVIIAFDQDSDTFDCLDEEGNIWTFEGIENWDLGDKITFIYLEEFNEVEDLQYVGQMDIFELSYYIVDACE